ncbi:PAS domain S-box protein [Halopelagius longus]|uniref:histidine kinase n=1 Tax=Halopelagius longus TaxID=1236180 RepID=A0A1H1BKY0_9EURY|nr:PAS domain S-box protein [Halopelagius longus]RDI70829.1 PAS domain S-box protein [Halopelagius longus]SDQ52665.1 PAS domain S-box-containing protein [Halopelagius longus]
MTSSPDADADSATRIRQQEVVAELGQRALETDDLDQLMRDAVVAVAETLDVEYAKVLELLPDGDEVFLRQGVGWREGLVGSATVPTDADSQAGYTLDTERPVIVDDLRTEERFSGPELLTSHDVVSGISVVIGSVAEPWGVLGTHTTEKREFTQYDANFVQSVANVLATAIENRETRRELEEIYGRISDAFFALDEEWNFTYLNERAHELINPENRELVGENIWEVFSAALSRAFEQEYKRAMYEQETVSFEEYYPEPLDTWFEVRAYPSETGLSVYFRDVSDRKEREQELELFRTLLDNTTDSVLVIDPETADFVDVNETACRQLGYDRDELLDLSVPEMERRFADIEDWNAHVEQVREEGAVTAEGVHVRKDGTTYPAEVNVTWVELDREYMVAVARDMTERRKRERRLRESEQQYRTLAENIPNGIITLFDDDLRYSLAAGRAFDELPIAPTDVEGRLVGDVWPDNVSDALESAYQAALDGEAQEIEFEYAGREWIVYVVPITDVDGEVFGGMTIGHDITERKEYQRRLEESNERLEQFAYAASHDLQEPLRMVSSYLSLIERRYGDQLDEDGEEFLEFAVDGADRMREMIDGLLEYSRVDTQGDPLEPTDLNEVLGDTFENLQMQIEETDAEITTEPLPVVEGDASQLRQLFQNLLSNAIEYSGDGPPRIRVESERDGREHLVSVHDDGIGIDPDSQDRVFEVFQRLHSHEEHPGTGIGLALCQRIVERHGGRIWVESEPGEGATFSFTLPAVDSPDERSD